MAFTLTPGNGTGAARLPAGKFLENCAFVTEKRSTSIAIGWSVPVSGLELHPPKSSGFSRRTFSPTNMRRACAWALHAPVPLFTAIDICGPQTTGTESPRTIRPRLLRRA
jgi:hypothetical protein